MKPRTKRARLDAAVVAAVAPVCQLFRLPHELLELVAVWFSRSEAVPILTVNSTLHEIFAERIWRRLDTYLADDRKTIPQASLLRYGHLVRRIRVTELLAKSIDLAAAFPNITHLWIPFPRLADTVKSSQGKCFERLSWLGTWAMDADYDMPETSDDVDPVLSWIDSRFEDEAGLEKMEWNLYNHYDLPLPYNILQWFQRNGQLVRIHFKVDNEGLGFGDIDLSDTDNAGFYKAVAHCLVDWTLKCHHRWRAAKRLNRALKSIPPGGRQNFTFPALKRLTIGTCCDIGNEVYSQLDFGKLFPSVRELNLDGYCLSCYKTPKQDFISILAYPWPSVRKLDVCGKFTYEEIIPHFAALSNVEELSMSRRSTGNFGERGKFNLCDLGRALPKLVRLKLRGFDTVLTPQAQQQKKLFHHLRFVSIENLSVTSSAISVLVRAPVLTDICLKRVRLVNDPDVDISDGLDLETFRRMCSAPNLSSLIGVTNNMVRSVDIYFCRNSFCEYDENTIRTILKCFGRLGICTVQSYQGNIHSSFLKDMPAVKIKHLN
ncbi:hypothetical protein GQ42DRAFT_160194 [Ramicandelaber brevisporus]|nr:hypothetical protein GQ42DRAFT_160194 [Ramicandelaber brevisporus]